MTNFLSYARGPQFMGRKLVRENELLRSGGLVSFPRTGCALSRFADLITRAVKSALRSHQPNAQRAPGRARSQGANLGRKLPDGRQTLPYRITEGLSVIVHRQLAGDRRPTGRDTCPRKVGRHRSYPDLRRLQPECP